MLLPIWMAERQEVAPVVILATHGPSRNIPNGDTPPKSPPVPAFAAVGCSGDTVLPYVWKEHLVRVSAATEWLLADVVSWRTLASAGFQLSLMRRSDNCQICWRTKHLGSRSMIRMNDVDPREYFRQNVSETSPSHDVDMIRS